MSYFVSSKSVPAALLCTLGKAVIVLRDLQHGSL